MAVLVHRSPRQLAAAPTNRWDPTREVEELQDRLGQLMQSFFGDLVPINGDNRAAAWPVPADIEETDDAYLVELDLPNVLPDEVNIELHNNELRIYGRFQDRERMGVLRRQTRRTGEFEYVVSLPGEIDPEDIEAALANGVLAIRVGKARADQPRRIPVSGNGTGQDAQAQMMGRAGDSQARDGQARGGQARGGQSATAGQPSAAGETGAAGQTGKAGQGKQSGHGKSGRS